MAPSSIDTIEWDTPVEDWPYPLSDERRAALSAHHACTDGGMISVVAVAPMGEAPNLILSLPAPVTDMIPLGEHEPDGISVRFGRMRLSDFESLPEHDGW